MFGLSKSLTYVFLNYSAYVLMFLNSLIMGKLVSVKMFGIYSFILLVNQYLYYSNLGTPYSLNTLVTKKKRNRDFIAVILANTILLNTIVSVLFVAIIIIILPFLHSLLLKYSLDNYILMIILGAIIVNFNNLLMQICRVYNIYRPINIHQILPPILIFILVLLKRNSLQPFDIILSYVICPLIALFLFIYYLPVRPHFIYNKKLFAIVLKRGINLLFYNMAFTFILTSAATIVSLYYSVDVFAQYKFAQNISSASVMITAAFTFLVYPKILNRFYTTDIPLNVINNYREIYLGAYNIVSFLFLAFVPFVILFYKEFIPAIPVFVLLLIAKVFTNQTGLYSIYYVSKKRELILCEVSVLSVLIVCIMAIFFVICGGGFVLVAFSVLVGSVIYYVLILLFLKKFTTIGFGRCLIKDFPLSLIIPLMLLILAIITKYFLVFSVLSLLTYLLFNYNNIKLLFSFTLQLQQNEKLLEF